MSESASVFVFGASGHAKVVIDAIEREGRGRIAFVCDDAAEKAGGEIMGYAIIGGREALLARRAEARTGIVAIGDNAARSRIAAWLIENGYALTSVVHPHAAIGREVEIGRGTVIMAGCVLNSGTRIGENAIINTGASIDHDCTVGEGVHVGPGSRLCGHVTVGARTLVGAGSTIVPGIRVGADAIVGAGSTVLGDIPDRARVGGSPCRPLAQ